MNRSDCPLVVPPGWLVSHRPVPEVTVAVTAPEVPPSGYRPRACLAAKPCALSLPDLLTEHLDGLTTTLVRPEVEDCDIQDLWDSDVGYLRLLHQVNDAEVITEAWMWLVGDIAWILSCSVALHDYMSYCDVFDDLATSFEPAA